MFVKKKIVKSANDLTISVRACCNVAFFNQIVTVLRTLRMRSVQSYQGCVWKFLFARDLHGPCSLEFISLAYQL